MQRIIFWVAECDFFRNKCTYNRTSVFYTGANPKYRSNYDGSTPLIQATRDGHLDVVRVLVDAGEMNDVYQQELHNVQQINQPQLM